MFKENKVVQKYEFLGGVFNTNKGYEGFHSVAYVRLNGDTKQFLRYDDESVQIVKEKEIKGYAKILFYCSKDAMLNKNKIQILQREISS